MSTETEISELLELDRTHWLHPQGDLGSPPGTMPQLMISHGEGAVLTDVEGLYAEWPASDEDPVKAIRIGPRGR